MIAIQLSITAYVWKGEALCQKIRLLIWFYINLHKLAILDNIYLMQKHIFSTSNLDLNLSYLWKEDSIFYLVAMLLSY